MAAHENRRRSERVMLRMTVLVTAEDQERRQIQEPSRDASRKRARRSAKDEAAPAHWPVVFGE